MKSFDQLSTKDKKMNVDKEGRLTMTRNMWNFFVSYSGTKARTEAGEVRAVKKVVINAIKAYLENRKIQ